MPKTDTNDLELGVTIRGVAAEQKLFGRYTLRKVLGRGGMGIVWLAHDDELKRNVAMKFLPDMIIRDREAVEDLKRETRRSLDLTHHHIVRIYDFTQDDTCAAIVMEYVDGDSLSALKTHQPTGCFGVSALQVWAGHVCQALDYAHRQARVVHRDLKPANLMVNSRGDLKVTDFGISRSMSDSMTRVSISNSAGTLAYMSPEQALGAPPAVGDDIYAFGATLYDLLTGRPPFFRGNLQVQLETVIPPLMDARRTELGNSGEPIPALWEEVIAACLSKRPQDRPHTMAEIANLLGVGGSSSSGTAATHGGLGVGIPGTSRTTSFAPGTSTTDRTISPEEMVTQQVRSKPSTPISPRTSTPGTPPIPTRAEDVFLNIAPARTPTAPPTAAVPAPTSRTAPRVEPTPTNRTAPTAPSAPPAPIERVVPAAPFAPVERVIPAAPFAPVERVIPAVPPAPVERVTPATPAPPVPEPEVAEAPDPVRESGIPDAIAPDPVILEPAPAPALEEVPEPVALKPSTSVAPPSAAESDLEAEPMTMPAVARKTASEPVAPAPDAEEASLPAAPPQSQLSPPPAPAQRPRIPEPPKPIPAPSVRPYQGDGHMIGAPRKKSAAPLIAAGVGVIALIGGLAAWFATHDAKPTVKDPVVPTPAPVVTPPVPTESETLTARAKELRDEGKLQEARLALSRALALDPANNAAINLLSQVDQGLAEEKARDDLDAKSDVLKRVDVALKVPDYLGAKRLIETVPIAHVNDPDVVSKKADIERLETNYRATMMAAANEKKVEEERRLAGEKAAAEAEAKRTAEAAEKERVAEAQRIAAANRKKEDPPKKKTTSTSKPKRDDTPPAPRIVRPVPTYAAPLPPRPPPAPINRPTTSKPRNPFSGGAPGG